MQIFSVNLAIEKQWSEMKINIENLTSELKGRLDVF